MSLLTIAVALLPGTAAPAPGTARNVDCNCWDISVIGVGGKGNRLLLANQGVLGWNIYDLSSQRTSILFSHGPLYRASITGKGARQLAADLSAYSARWSPNGRLIAFSTNGPGCASGVSAALLVITANGAGRRSVGECAYDGSWSPDSGRLAFVRRLPQGSVLTVAKIDGTGKRGLVSGPVDEVDWSPDGQWIAYTIGYPPRMHVVRVDDSENDLIGRGGSIRWSPNGRRLTYEVVTGPNRGALYVENRDGKRRLRLAPAGTRAAWSPNGRRLAYVGCHKLRRACQPAVYVVDANGARRRELVHGRGATSEFGPVYWSMDGRRILYTHDVLSGE